MRSVFLLSCLFLMVSLVNGQKNWTLEECITYALDHNIQVKQSMLTIENQETGLLQSKLNLFPSLNLGASHGYNWGQAIDLYTNEFATDRVQSNNFYASSSFTVFNGFQKINTIKKNQINLLRSQYETDQFMDDVSLNIAIAYLQVLYYREMVTIYEKQQEVMQQQVARTEKLVVAGTLARGDLLTIQAQAANEEFQMTNTRNTLEMSILNLAQLLDLPDTENFSIASPALVIKDELPTSMSVDNIYYTALEHRADVKSTELAIESASKDLNIAKGMQSPAVSLSANWGTGYSGAAKEVTDISTPYLASTPFGITANGVNVFNYTADATYRTIPFNQQFRENNNQTLTAYLSIPIFNGYQTRTAIANAKIGLENARLTHQTTLMNLRKTIQQAYADALASLKTYHAAELKLTANDESFLYAQEKFNVGMINSLEYNTAKKDHDIAQSEMLQSKYDFIFKSVILEFYMGKPLSLQPWQH
ncbi:MAG: TolC family protein [Bacteroidales bacterium]|nr:TolC family protein [Bacteroidales bacterium]MDD2322839.1 TolC family protein [Bacteroidales bacterium]MDD3962127.1 TolC family protein [Bacteroidales bacterium]MDY0286697.1 TolC family protein [Bacteroidales bacterium]